MSFYETDVGVWLGAVPPSGPFGAPETLGFWFQTDAPCKLAGFSQYSDGRHPNFALFQLWDATSTLLAQSLRPAKESARVPVGAGWRNVWADPRIQLSASTPYLVSASVTEFWAHFGLLSAAPLVVGHITVYQDGFSPTPSNGQYDVTTDASGYFSLINPPADHVAGHLYGIDVLLKF